MKPSIAKVAKGLAEKLTFEQIRSSLEEAFVRGSCDDYERHDLCDKLYKNGFIPRPSCCDADCCPHRKTSDFVFACGDNYEHWFTDTDFDIWDKRIALYMSALMWKLDVEGK